MYYQIEELLVFAHLLQVNADQNHNQSYQDLNHQNQRCSKSYPRWRGLSCSFSRIDFGTIISDVHPYKLIRFLSKKLKNWLTCKQLTLQKFLLGFELSFHKQETKVITVIIFVALLGVQTNSQNGSYKKKEKKGSPVYKAGSGEGCTSRGVM